MADAGFADAQAVADAIFYEGYLLYPYRRSSLKNRVRWQFGVLAPRGWIEARGPADTGVAGSAESWYQQTECLLEARDDAIVRLRLRFLHLEKSAVTEVTASGRSRVVDALEVGGHRYLSFEGAVPLDVDAAVTLADLQGGVRVPVECPGGTDVEQLSDGLQRGRVTRTRALLSAVVLAGAEPVNAPFPLWRLRVRTENTVAGLASSAAREEALTRSLLAAHTLIRVDAGSFLSLLDPPEWAADLAAGCRNIHTYPVLAGRDGATDLVLSSPIILYDHPQIAPESAGDLHDGTEIDEILSLRALTLTDAEKREARATDPRAAAIVDRVDTMPPEVWGRLHGAIRSLRPVTDDPGADSVLVDGVRVRKGSRVRLRPRARGTDAHDMFLTGKIARVDAVRRDIDGSRLLAVTLDDDPAAELHRWYGRFYYFRPDEVEPLPAQATT